VASSLRECGPRPAASSLRECEADVPEWLQRTNASLELTAYVHEILACSYARPLPNDLFLLPKVNEKNSFLIVEKIQKNIFFCHLCDDGGLRNMTEECDVSTVQDKYCIHSKAAEIIGLKEKHEVKPLDNSKDQVFIVQSKPSQVAVIYPHKDKKPGKRCRVCPGLKWFTASIKSSAAMLAVL
jgi:hypothetical protein